MLDIILPVILGLAVSAEVGHQGKYSFIPPEQCAFSHMSHILATEEGWHDLPYNLVQDPDFASELVHVMPDYRLAFAHSGHAGVLLVGGQKLDEMPSSLSQQDAYWLDTAEGVRAACENEEVRCDVNVFDDVPYGLRASTFFESEIGLMRRETLAFIDKNQCIYSIQFNVHEAALTKKAWQGVADSLMRLRTLVGGGL